MKQLLLLTITVAIALCGGCSGSDVLDESFSIVNNSDYELRLRYKINASELDAADASNYTEAGEFIADIDFTQQIQPGQTLTFYTVTMQQHATWHATGPAEPSEMFQSITVEAIENGQVTSQAITPIFEYYQEDIFPPEGPDNRISESDYEYTATINNSDIQSLMN